MYMRLFIYHHITKKFRTSITSQGQIPWGRALPITEIVKLLFSRSHNHRGFSFPFLFGSFWFSVRFFQYNFFTILFYYLHEGFIHRHCISARQSGNYSLGQKLRIRRRSSSSDNIKSFTKFETNIFIPDIRLLKNFLQPQIQSSRM